MSTPHYEMISRELGVGVGQVADTAQLLAGGATVPFIARYRKEATGLLDEVAITTIRDRLRQLKELDNRRESILKNLAERNLLTDALKGEITEAQTLSLLEDIYLPFRPKRRTRATVAREKGLESLAQMIFSQTDTTDPRQAALSFIDEEKGVLSVDEALAGARDIMAEWISEDPAARLAIRNVFWKKGVIRSKVQNGRETDGLKFKDYFEWEEPVQSAPSHRVLAMRRAEREGIVSLSMTPPETQALELLIGLFIKGSGETSGHVEQAIADGYKRLLSLSMETEIRMETKKRADETAIRVFVDNLRQLLLAPPLGQKAVMALDPGFRTGVKLVCLDRQGKLIHHDTIFPFMSDKAVQASSQTVQSLCARFAIEAIAIGNGTAGRETERFIRGLGLPGGIVVVMVNESGASVYSASDAARDEFPDHDLTVRGAVSIGRRLMDPLAELVKIEPRAIGVGQYQHDVDQGLLGQALDDAVVSCVNAVGVEVNTASVQLLSYVSGLGPALASSIVLHRDANGPFPSRKALMQVKRLGQRAFEQAAGFLRIRDSAWPLDASAVHPESYGIVEKMAADQGCSVSDLMHDAAYRQKVMLADYVTDRVGLPTLQDIMAELAKPGRDPRCQFESFAFTEGIDKMVDLTPGLKMTGVVTNITAFGAFVDIGVHQDGLVHLSQMADRFVKSPSDVVKVGQKVDVTVLAVDESRGRIALSMKKNPDPISSPGRGASKPGAADARQPKGVNRPKTVKPVSVPFNNPFAKVLKKNQFPDENKP